MLSYRVMRVLFRCFARLDCSPVTYALWASNVDFVSFRSHEYPRSTFYVESPRDLQSDHEARSVLHVRDLRAIRVSLDSNLRTECIRSLS